MLAGSFCHIEKQKQAFQRFGCRLLGKKNSLTVKPGLSEGFPRLKIPLSFFQPG